MLNRIIQFISFFFFGLALWLIIKEVEKVGLSNLWALISATPVWVVLLSCVFIAANYVAMSGYDVLALDYIRQKLPFEKVFKISSLGFAVSNTVGHAFISGGAVRYLFYTPMGVSKAQILVLIAFETLTLFMGMGMMYVFATFLTPLVPYLNDNVYLTAYWIVSVLIIVAFLVYYFFVVVSKRSITIGGVLLKSPTPKMTLMQLLVGFSDNFLISVVFYSVLRYHIETPFLPVFVVFNIAQITAQVSQVPGGLGVFASLFLLLFPHEVSQKGAILASLIVYRALYFFVPFFLALIYLGFYELKKNFYQNSVSNQ